MGEKCNDTNVWKYESDHASRVAMDKVDLRITGGWGLEDGEVRHEAEVVAWELQRGQPRLAHGLGGRRVEDGEGADRGRGVEDVVQHVLLLARVPHLHQSE